MCRERLTACRLNWSISSTVRIVLAGLCIALLSNAHASEGAEPSDLWSLEPVVKYEPPQVKRQNWGTGPIDRFILAKLEAAGFEPALPLERAKLIRRVYFDLCGLPPSPEDVRTFVADDSPQAYEKLIDRLLTSLHYGERWARYWLDVVRFAETNGYERDAEKKGAWKYRDWVIKSLNDDKPYDRFVLEQLAGDEIADANEESLVATGFLRVGTFDDEPNDPLKYKFEQLDDLIHATSTSFLAITLRCARCHDHKFDPIPQKDYYACLNFFVGGQASAGDLLGYTDKGRDVPPVKLLNAGDPRSEGEVVPPGFLSMVASVQKTIEPPREGAKTSGRREQLARWITDPKNPLTARAMVNRVWLWHFGEGLSRTPDNFGVMGTAPTHPQLLDWLAADFIENGWHIKRLHKMILLSSTYCMDSSHAKGVEYANKDFASEHWYRTTRHRLEAEPLRDAMLAVSGQLNTKSGGPGFYPPASKQALEGLSKKGAEWGTSPPDEQRRRSIYMFTKRSLLLPLLTVFDSSDTTQPCVQRNVSTVAPQALALLNNDFVHQQSNALACRVEQEVGDDPAARVERAWWLALQRPPTNSERTIGREHLKSQTARFVATKQSPRVAGVERSEPPDRDRVGEADHLALASLCHVLLNTNEFIYVD